MWVFPMAPDREQVVEVCLKTADAFKEKFPLFTIALLSNSTLRAIVPTITLFSRDKCKRFFYNLRVGGVVYFQAASVIQKCCSSFYM